MFQIETIGYVPEHLIPALDSLIESRFADLPEGYDVSQVESPNKKFQSIAEERHDTEQAIKSMRRLQRFGLNLTESIEEKEQHVATLKMLDFTDE